MSRKHRPSKADRKPVTRRYVARVVDRARQDILRAIVNASYPALDEDGAPSRTGPSCPAHAPGGRIGCPDCAAWAAEGS